MLISEQPLLAAISRTPGFTACGWVAIASQGGAVGVVFGGLGPTRFATLCQGTQKVGWGHDGLSQKGVDQAKKASTAWLKW